MVKRSGWFAVVLVGALSAGRLAAAGPRWTPIGPPAGPMAARLVLDPGSGSRAYALTAAGLWRTQNGGRTWISIQNGLDWPASTVAVDPSHPGRLYASVLEFDYKVSIRRSDDFGDHWTLLFRQSSVFLNTPQDLEVDPFAPNTLYWLRNQLLLRSRDGGQTWSCLPLGKFCSGPTFVPVMAFALSPVRPRTIYAQSNGTFFASFDGGGTWSPSQLPPNPPAAAGFAGDSKSTLQLTPEIFPTRAPHQLYLQAGYVSTSCFLRSDDDGATWHGYLLNRSCGNPAVDPDDPDTLRIVVATDGGPRLWVSHNGGDDGAFAGAVPALGDLYDFAGGGFLLAADRGLFRAAAEGGPWLPANRGFAASAISAILPTENGLFAAPLLPNNSAVSPPALPLLSTDDGGLSWVTEPLIDPAVLAADPRDPRHLIASAYRFEGESKVHYRVLESHDGGHAWSGVVDPRLEIPLFVSLAIDPFDPRTFYGGTRDTGFYRSTDGGRTWQRSNAGLPFSTFCNDYYCASNAVHTILADPRVPGRLTIHFEFQVYASVDGGGHWTFRGPPIPPRDGLIVLARGPGETLLAIASSSRPADIGRLGILYRSTDGGLTWTRAGRLPVAPRGSTNTITGFVATEAGLFVGTNFLGVLWSRDGGSSWTPLNDGLPSPAVTALAADPSNPGRIYAIVPQNGIYEIEVP
jgi:photosystem II stability/assembly factor-like uncharacterized protein